MRLLQRYHIVYFFIILLLCLWAPATGYTQIVIHESDSSWMNEEIPSKALLKKDFTFNRRWYQNLVTRYNFYFNTNKTLEEAKSKAGEIHKDNYDSLLSIAPYLPPDFNMLKADLDSVIINAGIGIEVHDPRGKWIDELYLLIGEAHYYQQNYEEAAEAFKYLIKNLGEKDEMGNPAVVGSRSNSSQKSLSLLTPEKKKKRYPPARNDAFIWLIRSYLHLDDYDRATSLMSSVEQDPNLPKRLEKSIYVIKANYTLEKGRTDSAQTALRTAIGLERDKKLKARWQFILSQLYEKEKQWDKAIAGYKGVNKFTPSPLMKFYSRLFQVRARIRQKPDQFPGFSQLMIDMAGKERYSRYRSIIYYQLGKLALESGFPQEGIAFLKKSLLFESKDEKDHFLANTLLAAHFYEMRKYRRAKKYYDAAAKLPIKLDSISTKRQKMLTEIVRDMDIIAREDSLQRLARLPKDTLSAFLDKIVADSIRSYKKQNLIMTGASENENNPFGQKRQHKAAPSKEEEGNKWYFYNPKSKSRGFTAFKAKWGKRALEDNWRLSKPDQITNADKDSTPELVLSSAGHKGEIGAKAENLLQKLLQPIPLTREAIQKSEEKVINARHKMINTFFLQLKDDSASLKAIQKMLEAHPDNPYLPDLYYKLYLIYSRIPDTAKASHYKQILRSQYRNTQYAMSLDEKPEKEPEQALETAINKIYNTAYTSYLTGNYQKVSTLQDSALYLDPQNKQKARFRLLYAMSLLKSNADSTAKVALRKLIKDNPPDTPVIGQAKLLLNKLAHKDELVEHLMQLQLPEATTIANNSTSLKNPEKSTKPISATPYKNKKEIDIQGPGKPEPSEQPGQKQAEAPQKQTTKEQPETQAEEQTPTPPEEEHATPADSLQKKKSAPATPYKIERQAPHFVILAFRKINGDLIKESLKDFSAYNLKHHARDSIEVSSYVLAHNRVILIFRLFGNEKEALLYYKELKDKAPENIVEGMHPGDYRLFFISKDNFILLNNSQDLEGYAGFFYKHFK